MHLQLTYNHSEQFTYDATSNISGLAIEVTYVQAPYNSQNYNRYSYCLNNPLKYTDPDGEWIHILVGAIIGSVVGTFTANIKSIENGDNFWKMQWKGLAAGIVGGAVGAATAATGGAAAAHFGTTGFIAGAATGAATGAVGGALGGASNAWLNGANFRDGFMAGMQGLWAGAATGFVTGGIGGGIDAIRHGGNFWSGDGATYTFASAETSNLKPSDVKVGADCQDYYNNAGLNEYADALYGDVDYVNNLSIDGNLPKGYHWDNGCIVSDDGVMCNGITRYVGNGKSDVFIGKSAFINSNKLAVTIGHEYIHATHYYMAFQGVLNINATYKGGNFLMTELAAYNWESSIGISNGYEKFSNSLGIFSWTNRPYFNWLLNR